MVQQGRTGGLLEQTTPRTGFLDDLIFPGGFRFHPLDEELLVDYLGKKVAGETLPFGLDDVIPTIPCFYGPDGEGDPRCLFQRLPLAARRQRLVQRTDEFYIFTRWEHCNAGGRPTRVAGPGTWSFNHDRAVVDERGRTLGRVGHLTFLLRGDKVDGGGRKRGKGATTHWVMHEYRLPDEEQGDEAGRSRASGAKKGRRVAQQQQPREGRLVLCRIRNTQKDNNGGGGRDLDVDEGDINLADGGDPPLLRPRKQKRGGPALEEEEEKEEPPQHPAVACSTLGIPPPPPPDDHGVRTDDAPGETCLATVDHGVMLPPPTAPPAEAMPHYPGNQLDVLQSTGGGGGGGPCAGTDLDMWVDEGVDGDWWTQLGDLVHGGGAATMAETWVTGDDDNHMHVPTAPAAAAAAAAPMPLVCAGDR